MFINFYWAIVFMKEIFTFSYYNHSNSLMMMNAFWKLWWLLCHAEAGTKKDKLGLNSLLLIYWSKLFDCHVECMFITSVSNFVPHKPSYTQQPLTMIGLYAFFFNQLIGRGCSSNFIR